MKVIQYIRREIVLSVAVVLAVISMFLVTPDKAYIHYIDFRTMGILFCLMLVMEGFRELGVFERLAYSMLRRVGSMWQLVIILVLLCFFPGMLITNDVALITFVPFTLSALAMLGEEKKRRFLIPVVAMQTLAANMGSMLTPLGNPQNLYLYGQSQMRLVDFILLMLPFTAVAFVLLFLWSLLVCRGEKGKLTVAFQNEKGAGSRTYQIFYLILFVLCLLTVARIVPYYITTILVFLGVLCADRKVLMHIDYALLITFLALFIFIGNVGRIEGFRLLLEQIVEGNELITAIAASQVISNVPAALLLSGFTDHIKALIVGTNLGGLGTLIASMASLISFKYISREGAGVRGRYLVYFTGANVVFLVIMLLLIRSGIPLWSI